MDIKALIREVPDFPKPGILFKDITTLLGDAAGLSYTIDSLADRCAKLEVDYIVGIESRGFLFGAPLACKLGLGFVPIRKPGKLPAALYSVEYALEYGTDCLEMHQDGIGQNDRVLIVDDVLATGGTAAAAAELIQRSQGQLAGFAFIMELTGLEGRKKLPDVPVVTLIEY